MNLNVRNWIAVYIHMTRQTAFLLIIKLVRCGLKA